MLGKTAAVVIGSFPLGESDRLVTFYSRDFGKIRGVAKSARRMRSRFGSALELCTLGELVFFDGGRGDLVQVDRFPIDARPATFRALRDQPAHARHRPDRPVLPALNVVTLVGVHRAGLS